MTPHEPRLSQGIPMTPISPGDLAVIVKMMNSYLVYVRAAFRASPKRDAHLQYVKNLREHLAGQHGENAPVPLTQEDIETIETAMNIFEVMTTQIVPPTKERDTTIAACACLRQHIARMRTGTSSRRSLN